MLVIVTKQNLQSLDLIFLLPFRLVKFGEPTIKENGREEVRVKYKNNGDIVITCHRSDDKDSASK